MKNSLLFYIIVLLGFTSCKSNEEKAAALIDKAMFKTLYDYASYEPVETIVTEGSTSIYTDSLIRYYAMMAEAARKLYHESKEKAEDAIEYADIYSGGYSYSSNRKFNEYMKQAKQETDNMTAYIAKWNAYEDSIKLSVAAFQPQKIGWEVAHKFRCKSKGGNSLLADYVYMMDPKFTTIIHLFDMDDEDETAIRERIDIAVKEE